MDNENQLLLKKKDEKTTQQQENNASPVKSFTPPPSGVDAIPVQKMNNPIQLMQDLPADERPEYFKPNYIQQLQALPENERPEILKPNLIQTIQRKKAEEKEVIQKKDEENKSSEKPLEEKSTDENKQEEPLQELFLTKKWEGNKLIYQTTERETVKGVNEQNEEEIIMSVKTHLDTLTVNSSPSKNVNKPVKPVIEKPKIKTSADKKEETSKELTPEQQKKLAERYMQLVNKKMKGEEWSHLEKIEVELYKKYVEMAKPETIKKEIEKLGSLSEKYESSGRGPGTVSTGIGDNGGVSYGTYQFASKLKIPELFLENEGKQWKEKFKDYSSGSKEFSKIWKEIAENDEKKFQEAQHKYVERVYFKAQAELIKSSTGLDVMKRSKTLRDVVWSTAVQHGPNTKIIVKTLKDKEVSKLDDKEIVKLIYSERGKEKEDGNLKYFSRSSEEMQSGIRKRFKNELNDALNQL